MSNFLLAFVGLIYLYVGFDYLSRGNPGLGLAFMAYCVSNVGFIIANNLSK